MHAVLALDDQVQKLACLDGSLAVVRHQPDQCSVPLVDALGERGRPGGHQQAANAVAKLVHGFVVDAQEGLRSAFLRAFINEAPDAVPEGELFGLLANLWQDAHFEATHCKQEVRVVAAVDRDKAVLPLDCRDRARKPILHVPKDGASEVDVVLHQTHSTVARPALLVVVADDVLVIWIGMLGQVVLDEIPAFVGREAEHDEDAIDVATVQPDRMAGFDVDALEPQKVARRLQRAGKLACAVQAEQEQVEHQAVVLEDERRELQPADQTVRVRVAHVLVGKDNVAFGRHVVGNVVVDNQAKQAVQEGQVDLFGNLAELCLHHYVALSFRGFPDIGQVVHALTELVDEQRRRLMVARLDPVWEEVALVGFVPQVLIEIGIGDLLERLDVVARNHVAV